MLGPALRSKGLCEGEARGWRTQAGVGVHPAWPAGPRHPEVCVKDGSGPALWGACVWCVQVRTNEALRFAASLPPPPRQCIRVEFLEPEVCIYYF